MGMLKPAINKMAFAKIGLYGEAGSGKTLTAAKIAIGLVKEYGLEKPVGMFDTEPAASYLIPRFKEAGIDFLVYDESRALNDLMRLVDEAEEKCSVIIADSITHVWRDAQDSYIAKVNEKRKKQRKPPIYQLEFHHWKPIKAAWQKFTDRFLSSKVHFIVCGRAGSIYEYQKNEESGKMELITSGTKMATEKELGYEPSLLIEMVKHREDGEIINRALIEKDRADKLNGHEIDMPDFANFIQHFEALNIGGSHFASMNQRDSQDMFTLGAEDDGFNHEKTQREIALEELKALFVLKGIDGSDKDSKQKRIGLLKMYFGTTSWTAITQMRSDKIKSTTVEIKKFLEGDAKGSQLGVVNG